MKNWFIKKRDDIVVAIIAALSCAMIIGMMICGTNNLKDITVTFDDGIESIELTDEMVEAYVDLVEISMEG